MSGTRTFTHCNGSVLRLWDHGTHLRATLDWHGPLDDLNQQEALNWLRPLCVSHGHKPLILNTPKGRIFVLSEGNRTICERILTRHRFQ